MRTKRKRPGFYVHMHPEWCNIPKEDYRKEMNLFRRERDRVMLACRLAGLDPEDYCVTWIVGHPQKAVFVQKEPVIIRSFSDEE